MSKSSKFVDAPPAYSPLPPAAPMQGSVCCISLDSTDRLRLVGCSPQLVEPIRDTIKATWGEIQVESLVGGAYEFKLLGNPWAGQGKSSVSSRRLVMAVLCAMAKQGWSLSLASNSSKIDLDKDTLYFERATPDPNIRLAAVSFNMVDRIRVIDMPSLVPFVKSAIVAQWEPGIDAERIYYEAHEFKLVGFPWHPRYNEEAVMSRMLCAQIFANLRAQGYILYGSLNSSFAAAGLDTWIFRCREPSA
ncbi:hypothetical protein DFQ26_002483 [Actinomortierella ambigua]|nr:hypothetical protein DFQ26_002483 [Actinomortierella ambigua]